MWPNGGILHTAAIHWKTLARRLCSDELVILEKSTSLTSQSPKIGPTGTSVSLSVSMVSINQTKKHEFYN